MNLHFDSDKMEDIIANRLMMLRRGNPDMGGPSMQDRRWAKELVEDLLWHDRQTPEGQVVQAGQQVLEALRARTKQLVAEGRCPHACYHYESMSQIPICSDCGADLTEDMRTWID